ncbi:TPA: hypothetical protein EYP66_23905, partial [Candidatus Poribacteria bacterium]|nr:hypothetical protein [Candidatus Poribacteria bacterium]
MKLSDTILKIQSSQQVKRFIGLAILLGFEVILGAALAKFTDSPILLALLFGALTIAALVNIEYTFYVLIFCLPFSYRYIMPPRTEMRIPTEPLLAILLCAFFIQKIFGLQKLSRSASQGESPRFPFWLP